MNDKIKISDHFHKSKVTTIVLSAISFLLCVAHIKTVKIEGAEVNIDGPFWPVAFFVAATATGIGLWLTAKIEVPNFLRNSASPEEGVDFGRIRSDEADQIFNRLLHLRDEVEKLSEDDTFKKILGGDIAIIDHEKVMSAISDRMLVAFNSIDRSGLQGHISDLPHSDTKNHIQFAFQEVRQGLEGMVNAGIEILEPEMFSSSMKVRNVVDTCGTNLSKLIKDINLLKLSINRYNKFTADSVKWIKRDVSYNYSLPIMMWLINVVHLSGYLGYGYFPSIKKIVESCFS